MLNKTVYTVDVWIYNGGVQQPGWENGYFVWERTWLVAKLMGSLVGKLTVKFVMQGDAWSTVHAWARPTTHSE